jgi:hypothetical protein
MYWPSGRRLPAGEALQSRYAERFEREMGCTEAEWLGWLPGAIGANAWRHEGASAQVRIGEAGTLVVRWCGAEPRVIAMARIPRLLVSFRFAGMDDQQRYAFMKRFDLYMQRGGG